LYLLLIKLLTSSDFEKLSDEDLIIDNQQFRQQQKYNFYRLLVKFKWLRFSNFIIRQFVVYLLFIKK
jgi:hypothetical protein